MSSLRQMQLCHRPYETQRSTPSVIVLMVQDGVDQGLVMGCTPSINVLEVQDGVEQALEEGHHDGVVQGYNNMGTIDVGT